MSTTIAATLAIAFSTLLQALLTKSDAKRHRREGRVWAISQDTRKVLAWAALLPAPVLLYAGLVSALLIWLGAITISGWLLVLLPPAKL